MIQPISSSLTFFYKWIFSCVWIALFGVGIISMLLARNHFHDRLGSLPPSEIRWQFLAFWIIGSLFIWWFCIRLKRIRLDDKTLYISNYFKEIRVPLENVAGVSENRWINTHLVTLVFKNKTQYGISVVFMPTVRWISFFSSHPVVSEIRVAVERARKK